MFSLLLWCVSGAAVPQETGFKENDICPFTSIVGLKGSNKPYSKINFSDLKGPCCIPVTRIKYRISPKSYYTVMNIPSHCQEPGSGFLWCLPYWWAIILLRGSVWIRSQEAQILPCGAPKPGSSSWAASTLVIPASADPPPYRTEWATENPHHLSRGTHQSTGLGSELWNLRRERWHLWLLSCRCHRALFRNQGCSIFSQAPALWVILGNHVILLHALYLVTFTSSPRKLGNSYVMLDVTPQDIQGDASPKM